MPEPEIAVLISTYQRPRHLRRSLLSLALQRGVAGRMEVVVNDDGSPETSRPVAEAFARTVDFPVRFTTHPHGGFQLARCRNEGIAVSQASYLLISDGDCVFPPDHIQQHLAFRRTGQVAVGDCLRWDEFASERATDDAIRDGSCFRLASRAARRRLSRKAFHAFWYQLLGLRMLPRLTGSNIGVWRSDLEAINGFDENFVGWGLEDRDLQLRLSRLGLRFKSILRRTAAYHLWHEPAPTFARNNLGTRNLEYYRRGDVPTRCLNGLRERIAASADHLCEARVLVRDPHEGADDEASRMRLLPFPAPMQPRPLSKVA
jgi:glycosyltransferase involved in cell wall biosynthesis